MEAGGEFVLESAVAGEVIEWVAYFRYWHQKRPFHNRSFCELATVANVRFAPDSVAKLPLRHGT
jgi:hypothetical protein